MKVSRFGLWLLRGVCASVIMFAVLRLIASAFVVKSTWGGVLGYGFVIAVMWMVFEYMGLRFPAFWGRYEILFLLGLCFIVHLFLIGILPSMGRNEWATSADYQYAVKSLLAGKICRIHRDIYTYWCNYEIVLSSLAVLFGGRLELGQVVNACSCVFVVGTYFTFVKGIAGIRVARLAALILGLSPVLVMASTLLTGEFLAAAFMLMAFCFFFSAANETETRRRVFMIVFSGCALGISHLFKSVSIIFVVAVIVACLSYLLYAYGKGNLIKVVLLVSLLLPSYVITKNVGQSVLRDFVGSSELGKGSTTDTLVYELALGLNIPSGGQWEQKLAEGLKRVNTSEKKAYLKNAIARDWRGYPLLMVKKFVNLHGSHNQRVGIIQQFTDYFRKKNEKAKGWHDYWTRYIPTWVEPLSDAGMSVFEILFLFGAIGLLLSLKRPCAFWMPGVLSVLIVIEFAIVEQLIEVAGRYKITVYPFYFMVIPYICVLFEKDIPLYVHVGKIFTNLIGRLRLRHEC